MIRRRKRPKRKELRFPIVMLNVSKTVQRNKILPDDNKSASSYTRDKEEIIETARNRRLDKNVLLCLSDRGPRPKPDREWTPLSVREKQNMHTDIEGLYSKHVDSLYRLITRQNSSILPPIATSRRMKGNVFDEDKLQEKRYVMMDAFREGKMSRFARDQCYLPSVYNQFLNCKTCKKSYVNDKYIEEYKKRNYKTPTCSNRLMNSKVHFCDVLGKRCCATCIESENREFSRRIENRLQGALTDSESSTSDLCFDFG
ncbi:uncharacterized protein LOC134686022 [Mytilus trossulus]|uniref:uncharacterized protein LOC134686022 n=1 Tax=Mytilus trossulus TaxID=6551 RepID=UPI003005C5F6